jgi:hypothetical protein
VTGRYSQDRLGVIGWVASGFEGNGHVSGSSGDDELVEVTVADDEVPEPSAVDVSALCVSTSRAGLPATPIFEQDRISTSLSRSLIGRSRSNANTFVTAR